MLNPCSTWIFRSRRPARMTFWSRSAPSQSTRWTRRCARGHSLRRDIGRYSGWDASGMVRAIGADVTLFQPGDRVWYAGSLQRPGSNSEVHLVDERLAGTAPKSLDFAAAAALPLTTITAWEMLFERLAISPGKHHHGQSILIVGAAGGVGSILTQLARRLTGLKVIATASRPETAQWVRELGAHEVIDHMRPLGR